MSVQSPFQPKRGANQKVTATTSSQAITIGLGNKSLRVVNAGAVVGYFVTYRAADETRTCTNADTPVGPVTSASSTLIIEKPEQHDTLAYLSDSSTAVMHFQPGEGGV